MEKDIQKVLLNEEQIAAKVKELGRVVSMDYAGKNPLVDTAFFVGQSYL